MGVLATLRDAELRKRGRANDLEVTDGVVKVRKGQYSGESQRDRDKRTILAVRHAVTSNLALLNVVKSLRLWRGLLVGRDNALSSEVVA